VIIKAQIFEKWRERKTDKVIIPRMGIELINKDEMMGHPNMASVLSEEKIK
jgi:hypothetical protein